jgi:hypothetical protein
MNDKLILGTAIANLEIVMKPQDEKKYLDSQKKLQKKQEKIVVDSNKKASKQVLTTWERTFQKIAVLGGKSFGFLRNFSSLAGLGALTGVLGLGGGGLLAAGFGVKALAGAKINKLKEATVPALSQAQQIADFQKQLGTTSANAQRLFFYAQNRGIDPTAIAKGVNRVAIGRIQNPVSFGRFNKESNLANFLDFLSTVGDLPENLQKEDLQSAFGGRLGLEFQKLITDINSGDLQKVFDINPTGINQANQKLIGAERRRQLEFTRQDIEQSVAVSQRSEDVVNKLVKAREIELDKINRTVENFDDLNRAATFLAGTLRQVDKIADSLVVRISRGFGISPKEFFENRGDKVLQDAINNTKGAKDLNL